MRVNLYTGDLAVKGGVGVFTITPQPSPRDTTAAARVGEGRWIEASDTPYVGQRHQDDVLFLSEAWLAENEAISVELPLASTS